MLLIMYNACGCGEEGRKQDGSHFSGNSVVGGAQGEGLYIYAISFISRSGSHPIHTGA